MISFTESKDRNYDPEIQTPTLFEHNYLKKNNQTSKHKGKMSFEHFLKSIELIAVKLYPDFSTDEVVKFMIKNHFMRLVNPNSLISQKNNKKNQHVRLLMDILKDPLMVKKLFSWVLFYLHVFRLSFWGWSTSQ